MKMMERKETIRNLLNFLIIICVILLLGILCGFVFGILDLGETAGIFLRTAGLLLLISLGMKLISQYYMKSLTQEMKEEEIRESEQEDEKQLLFKPTTVSILIFLFLILLGIYGFFTTILSKNAFNADVFAGFIGAILLIGGGLYMWYTVAPVFIFTEDSVQIKSHLFYFFHIDRKTVIRFADITSVGPNMKGNYGWGVEHKHSLMISMNGTTKGYGLACYNDEKIAKIWLRFREKLGDKVKLE
jgi:hypothetical protein